MATKVELLPAAAVVAVTLLANEPLTDDNVARVVFIAPTSAPSTVPVTVMSPVTSSPAPTSRLLGILTCPSAEATVSLLAVLLALRT